MDIAVLSGKGGTGKTTVSTNLFYVAGKGATLLDCDVEEPNSHLFFELNYKEMPVSIPYPVVDSQKCINCGDCGRFCTFKAILPTPKANIVLKELCHGCGGCKIVCRQDAISYETRVIGSVFYSGIENKKFVWGRLNTGEYSTTEIIKKTLDRNTGELRIIDAPPGVACAAVESVSNADFALIVTEPTPFALSDMKMVVEMLREMKIKMGVFINKSGDEYLDLITYLREQEIPIMGQLENSNKYGKCYASGGILSREFNNVNIIFRDLLDKILQVGGFNGI